MVGFSLRYYLCGFCTQKPIGGRWRNWLSVSSPWDGGGEEGFVLTNGIIVFEDASLQENVASAVEKQIHFGENGVEYHPGKRSFMHLETLPAYMDERSAWSD